MSRNLWETLGFKEGLVDFLANYNFRDMIKYGWTGSHVSGMGVVAPTHVYVSTNAVANARALLYHYIEGMNPTVRKSDEYDFDVPVEIIFKICADHNVATAIRRVQFRQKDSVPAEDTDLVSKGFGLKIENSSVRGEAYGTARQETPVFHILTADIPEIFRVKLIPRVAVEFYVRNRLMGRLTGTAVPSGQSGEYFFMVIDVINQTTAARCNLYLFDCWMIQHRGGLEGF